MALLDDLNKAIDGIGKITTDGVPLKIQHDVDKDSLTYIGAIVLIAGLVLVIASGMKDYIVGRALRR